MLDYVAEIPLPGRIVMPDIPPSCGGDRLSLPAFVAGGENRLVAGVVDGLMQIAGSGASRQLPRPAFPILVLVGASGTGKSHLAYGLVRHWQTRRGAENAHYTTAADFRHLFNEAIKRQAEEQFRVDFRRRQLLAIDDLHRLPAERHVMQELRFTLDEYEERGGTIVVTSSLSSSSLPNLSTDVRSRLSAGLELQLNAPGHAARARILDRVAQVLGEPISPAAIDRLARSAEGTPAQLFGALFELCAKRQAGPGVGSEAAAQVGGRAARRPTLRGIIAVVARHQHVSQARLKSNSRRHSIVFARSLVILLARELAGVSYEEVGRALGGRDHSTILYSYRKIAAEREVNPQTQEMITQLRRILLSH